MSKRGARILVVDDEIEIIRALQRSLTVHGYEVFTASNGEEALERIGYHRPDLVLLDLGLPGMSGLEAASYIVASGSRVLMFTMHESEHLASEVSQAGAHGFVLKSQAGKDLIRAIERLLRGGTFFGSDSDPQENAPGPTFPAGKLTADSFLETWP